MPTLTKQEVKTPPLPRGLRFVAKPQVAPVRDDGAQWAVLAGLRFLLATVVMCSHHGLFAVNSPALTAISQLGPLVAVLGFLLVSGYSIGASIERDREQFYRRRTVRILPCYLTALLFSLAIFAVVPMSMTAPNGRYIEFPDFETFAGNTVFLQGYVVNHLSSDAPVWSLSVEVAFYALAPLLTRLRTAWLLAIIGASAALYGNFTPFRSGDLPSAMHGQGLLWLGWAWLGGFLVWRHRTSKWAKVLPVLVGAALLVRNNPIGGSLSLPLWILLCVAVALAGKTKLSDGMRKPLTWLGDVSYPLYLVHYPAFLLLAALTAWTNPTPYLALALALAVVCFYAVDLPCRRNWRNAGISDPRPSLGQLRSLLLRLGRH